MSGKTVVMGIAHQLPFCFFGMNISVAGFEEEDCFNISRDILHPVF